MKKKIYSVQLVIPRHVRNHVLKDYCFKNNITIDKGKYNKVFTFSSEDEHQLNLLRFKFPLKEHNPNDHPKKV